MGLLLNFIGGFGQGASEAYKMQYLENANRERMQMLRDQNQQDRAQDREWKTQDETSRRDFESKLLDKKVGIDKDAADTAYTRKITEEGMKENFTADQNDKNRKAELDKAKIKDSSTAYYEDARLEAKQQKQLESAQRSLDMAQKRYDWATQNGTDADIKAAQDNVERMRSNLTGLDQRINGGQYDFNTSDTTKSSKGTSGSVAQYKDLIYSVSKEYDVNPNLIQSMMGQESAGKADAVSPKGATGLMQIMPKTAADLAKELNTTPDKVMHDPATNIRAGALYLSQQLDKYNGDEQLALAAYNFGPNAVDDKLKASGAKSFDAIKDKLPAETQNYVPSIMKKYDPESKWTAADDSPEMASDKISAELASRTTESAPKFKYNANQIRNDKTLNDILKDQISSVNQNPAAIANQALAHGLNEEVASRAAIADQEFRMMVYKYLVSQGKDDDKALSMAKSPGLFRDKTGAYKFIYPGIGAVNMPEPDMQTNTKG